MSRCVTRKLWIAALTVGLLSVGLATSHSASALTAEPGKISDAKPEKFAVGRFERGGERFLGLVLREAYVVDLKAANKALQRSSLHAPKVPMPADIKELAGRYNQGLKRRVYQIVNYITDKGLLAAADRPHFIHRLGEVKTLAPHRPYTMLNAAVNYAAHGEEMGGQAHEKGTPYLFLKATSSIVGNGHPLVLPREGYPWVHPDMMDWEVELAVVIGDPARYASLEDAPKHIFGYTVHIDVSNRGGRGDDSPMGSDWLVGKGLDTYGPLGPWIVPAEFISNPDDLGQRLTVNGQVMQDSNTSYAINKPADLIYYASSILTLQAGDVIALGTPEGVGAGRDPQVFLKEGDVVEAWIEEIGSLRHQVVKAR